MTHGSTPGELKTIALASGRDRPGTREFAEPLVAALHQAGVKVLVDEVTAQTCALDWSPRAREELVAEADMLVVMGGDGTLLRWAHLAAPAGVPVLGVDLGSFGFLAAAKPAAVLASIPRLLAGDYHIRERLMLAVEVRRGDEVTSRLVGLNEAVVARTHPGRLVRLDTRLNGELVAVYPVDGLIIATPTGSTAYNLSAGGPLVDPELECFILNPICPHSLYLRPLVVAAGAVVTVAISAHHGDTETARLIVDGQTDIAISTADLLVIARAPFSARLVSINSGSFIERLHTKLRWGTER